MIKKIIIIITIFSQSVDILLLDYIGEKNVDRHFLKRFPVYYNVI